MNLRRRTVVVSGAIVAAFALAAAVVFSGLMTREDVVEEPELNISKPVSHFEMDDVLTGERYSSDTDTVKLMAFILRHCPDGACPATMVDFADIQRELKERELFGDEVELITVTIDPARDTPEELAAYARAFDADEHGWRVLRGDRNSELRPLAAELGYQWRLNEDGTGYHALTMYVLDRTHTVRAYHRMSTVDDALDHEQILRELSFLAEA